MWFLLRLAICSTLCVDLGCNKTLKCISKVFFWPDVRNDVIMYIYHCRGCQQAKRVQNVQVSIHQT
jgi:hypothetical protein